MRLSNVTFKIDATNGWHRKPGRSIRATCVFALATSLLVSACGGGSDKGNNGGNGDAGVGAGSAPAVALSCDDSIKSRFKPDELTSVVHVKAYAKGEALPNVGLDGAARVVTADLCLVKLLVGPGNPGPVDAPSTSAGIGIEVWLPEKSVWNGRLHAMGSGGWGGTEEANPALVSHLSNAWIVAGQEGAVTVTSDTGHASKLGIAATADGSFAMNPDGTINTTLWSDWSHRAIHEQVVKAKALAKAYYGSAPKRSYWDGFSSGGRQGLKQAMLYPEDFDGIVVGAPVVNFTKFVTAGVYPQVAMRRELGAILSPEQLALVSNASIAACDLVNGEHLGFPIDAASCRYDPVKDLSVLCIGSGGTNVTSACVTTAQAQTINRIWYGMTPDGSVPDPASDNGWSTTLTASQRWYGVARGTNLMSLAGEQGFPIGNTLVALELQNPTIAKRDFLNATGNGQDGWRDLTYLQLSYAYDRGLALQSQFANINTDDADLSRFRARGGKVLIYHGIADEVVPPQGSVHYYTRVRQAMGASAVDDFMLLYLVPGMGHFGFQGTANLAATPPLPRSDQMYAALTDWVESGVQPSRITVSAPADSPVQISLPLCPHPTKITYQAGSVREASSYACL